MPPKGAARLDRGILPVDATARAPKSPAPRLKLEIRHLPPSLTLTEFEEVLGPEWVLGKGKIDWREYRQGKIKSPGKRPEQSRCYVHLKSEGLIAEFEARFKSVLFHDKAATHRLPEIKHLPPTLDFAPNQRTTLGVKQRLDNRQGTIDQDPEFIAFLEAETQPITKPAAVENNVDKEKEDIKSTPLIDDLRERKANKAKAAITKAEREKEKKKTIGKSKEHELVKGKENIVEKDVPKEKVGKETKTVNTKPERAVKQPPKGPSKQPAKAGSTTGPQPEQKPATSEPPSKGNARAPRDKKTVPNPAPSALPNSATPASVTIPTRPRQPRNNLEGIRKMLQKDLGVKAAQSSGSTPTAPATATVPSKGPSQQTPGTTTAPPTARPGSRGTATATNKASSSSSQAQQQTQTQTQPKLPSSLPTKAYLKHANPSQGMSEMLIQQALSVFGPMINVTIDPRKGTAIAVFADNEGLKKAIAAKRVTVAAGAVEILEFKDRAGTSNVSATPGSPSTPPTGPANRGGFRGGRGGGRGGNRNVGSARDAVAGTAQKSATAAVRPTPSVAIAATPPAVEALSAGPT